MSPPAKDVDEYLAALPGEQRAALRKLRETIRAAAPEAAESISYRMPTFKYQGRPLIYFGAAKNHCAVYAINTNAHKDELKGTTRRRAPCASRPTSRFPKRLWKSSSRQGSTTSKQA